MQPGSSLVKTLRCRRSRVSPVAGFGQQTTKHVRGGAGKPGPPRRKGEPQRGKRHEGMGFVGLRLGGIPFRRGKPFEAVRAGRVWCKTAREERTRKRVRISGRRKALKANAQVLPG